MELSGVRFRLGRVEIEIAQHYQHKVTRSSCIRRLHSKLLLDLFSESIVKEIMLCPNLQSRRVATK